LNNQYGKVALVVIGGFYFTLVSTAISVLAIRDLLSSSNDEFPETVPPLEEISDKSDISTEDDADTSIETDAPPLNSSFSDKLTMDMRVLKVASAITATVASLVPAASTMVIPLTTAFLLFTTLDAFVFGARLPKRFTKIVHPLVTCTAGTWLSMKLFGLINGFSFPTMLHKYRTGMITLTGAGAGDILLFLLGPAVISLACQMYDRRKLIQENFAEVTTAVLVSSLGGLFGTAFAVRALEIGNPALRLSLLSRNITRYAFEFMIYLRLGTPSHPLHTLSALLQ
jgi:putative effector of murein hydrolase